MGPVWLAAADGLGVSSTLALDVSLDLEGSGRKEAGLALGLPSCLCCFLAGRPTGQPSVVSWDEGPETMYHDRAEHPQGRSKRSSPDGVSLACRLMAIVRVACCKELGLAPCSTACTSLVIALLASPGCSHGPSGPREDLRAASSLLETAMLAQGLPQPRGLLPSNLQACSQGRGDSLKLVVGVAGPSPDHTAAYYCNDHVYDAWPGQAPTQ